MGFKHIYTFPSNNKNYKVIRSESNKAAYKLHYYYMVYVVSYNVENKFQFYHLVLALFFVWLFLFTTLIPLPPLISVLVNKLP